MVEHEEHSELERLAKLRYSSPAEYLGEKLGEHSVERIVSSIDNGVPGTSFAVMARWWQLETYLRDLVYVTLKGQFGPKWSSELVKAEKRAEQAAGLRYMSSPDDNYLLAHVDVSVLFRIIDEHWDNCSSGIGLPKTVWLGRAEEVKPIRHRLAHCRRPHNDDVARIEQLLRDLEPGACSFLRSYAQWGNVSSNEIDPVARAWIKLEHPDADIVEHGRNNKASNSPCVPAPYLARRILKV